jgi:hypothetical protein
LQNSRIFCISGHYFTAAPVKTIPGLIPAYFGAGKGGKGRKFGIFVPAILFLEKKEVQPKNGQMVVFPGVIPQVVPRVVPGVSFHHLTIFYLK